MSRLSIPVYSFPFMEISELNSLINGTVRQSILCIMKDLYARKCATLMTEYVDRAIMKDRLFFQKEAIDLEEPLHRAVFWKSVERLHGGVGAYQPTWDLGFELVFVPQEGNASFLVFAFGAEEEYRSYWQSLEEVDRLQENYWGQNHPEEGGFSFKFSPNTMLNEREVFPLLFQHIPSPEKRASEMARSNVFKSYSMRKTLDPNKPLWGYDGWLQSEKGRNKLEQENRRLQQTLPPINQEFAQKEIREVLRGC